MTYADNDYEYTSVAVPGPRRWLPLLFLIVMVLLGAGAAYAWRAYSALPPVSTAILTRPEAAAPPPDSSDKVLGLIRDLQATDRQTADQIQNAMRLIGAQQAQIKLLSDQVGAMAAQLQPVPAPPVPAPPPAAAAPAKPKKPPHAAAKRTRAEHEAAAGVPHRSVSAPVSLQPAGR